MAILINIKIFLWFIAIMGAFTLINFKIASTYTNKNCDEKTEQIPTPDRYSPIIFIGGFPRSGTTLMRVMLDAHPDVRCGKETRIIPRMIQYHNTMFGSKQENVRLSKAGVNEELMNRAFAKFYLEIIANHDYPAPRLCNKDPLVFMEAHYMHKLFPNAKFLFMIRDGRAVVYSILSRNITMKGVDTNNFGNSLLKWNEYMDHMTNECELIGESHCMWVYYEQLVLKPKKWMEKILKFLDLPWNDAVLHHEDYINRTKGIYLSDIEPSSDQVAHPIYLDALSAWVGHIPNDVFEVVEKIAPMLSFLGYDPFANPPDYTKMEIND